MHFSAAFPAESFAFALHIYILDEVASMESIKRKVFLLRPEPPKMGRATLKLSEQNGEVEVHLAVQGLSESGCALYLFEQNGKPYRAGDIAESYLAVSMRFIKLEAVAGAAVVCERTNAFLFKSAGIDWQDTAARFRIARNVSQPPQTTVQDAPWPQAKIDGPCEETAAETDSARNDDEQAEPSLECMTCPHVIRQDKINPFPSVFPQSEWVKISYPGPTGWWHYISGKIFSNNKLIAKVLGVPGEYGLAPPIWLEGFGSYMRCALPDASGYWLMFQDAQTGEVLDMDLSQHDA